MEIREDHLKNVVVLKLSGGLDSRAVPLIRNKVKSLLENNHIRLVFDFAKVDFIDSSGLGSLVASLRSVNKAGGDIKISALRSHVRAVFELIRLHFLFEIYQDSEAAAKNFHEEKG